MNSNKGTSHKGPSNIAHAEAALGAGRPYEKAMDGHNEMFSSVKELEEHNKKQFAHGHTMKQSRGDRIDSQLAEEDKETIERMNQAHRQREEAKHRKED